MTHNVIVRFGPDQAFDLKPALPLHEADARDWLDAEYQRLECQPPRASGKVLFADKLLALASAMGEAGFAAEPDWAAMYGRAAAGALGKRFISVDVPNATVGS